MSVMDMAISLSVAPVGAELEVVSLNGGCEFKRRMTALGILRNVRLSICQNHPEGGRVISLGEQRLALGHGVCRKIKVAVR